MDNKLRIALAQIDFQPSYVGIEGAYIDEPLIYPDKEKGLLELPNVGEIKRLKKTIRRFNLSNQKIKIEAILEYAVSHKIDLIAFPEYSIPYQLLELVNYYSKKFDMIIIGGSHSVVINDESIKSYQESELLIEDKLGGVEPIEDSVRKAICPIFTPVKNYVITKMTKSKWEGNMVIDDKWEIINIDYPGVSIKLAVLLCIDALNHDNMEFLYANGLSSADIIVIPSFSPSVSPFKNVALSNLINEKPTIYCNTAFYGGSKIFANFGTESKDLFLASDGTAELGKQEIIVGVEIDLLGQFKKPSSAKTYFPVKSVCLTPIIYESKNGICASYCSEYKNFLRNYSRENALELAHKYCGSSENLPSKLTSKLSKLAEMLEEGIATKFDVLSLLDVIIIDKEFLDINDLRFSLAKLAYDNLSKILTVFENKRLLLEVLLSLDKLSRHLSTFCCEQDLALCEPFIDFDIEEPFTLPDTKFEDRGGAFDVLSGYINNQKKKVFYIDGLKGIGKTSLINEFFNRKLGNIKPVKITAVKRMSFERFILSIFEFFEIPINPSFLLKRFDDIVGQVKNLVIRKKVFIIDEFHFLLIKREFGDERIV